MGAWVTVGFVAGAALVVVLVALFRSTPIARRHVPAPLWSIPTPQDLRDTRFPLALQGYDPEHVDVMLGRLVEAYEELYLAAGPGAIANARERLEERDLRATLRS